MVQLNITSTTSIEEIDELIIDKRSSIKELNVAMNRIQNDAETTEEIIKNLEADYIDMIIDTAKGITRWKEKKELALRLFEAQTLIDYSGSAFQTLQAKKDILAQQLRLAKRLKVNKEGQLRK